MTQQLKQQNYQNLEQETRSYGLSLYDRLVRVDNSLRNIENIVSGGENIRKSSKGLVGYPNSKIFKAIYTYYTTKKAVPILGKITDANLTSVIQEYIGGKKTKVVFRNGTDNMKKIFFLVPIYHGNELAYFLVAEIDPFYIWGIGSESILPTKTELSIEAYQDIIPMVVQHHEHYDGSGYPAGLSGEAIDLLTRILMVADVFDALISNRPYRDGWVVQNAKKFIVEGAGSHFDPEVVNAFMELPDI